MIEAYLTENATLISAAARDSWGESGTTVETAIKVRDTGSSHLVTNQAGEQVFSQKTLLLKMQDITHEDRIRLSDGKEYAIASIETKRDFDAQFLEVRLI